MQQFKYFIALILILETLGCGPRSDAPALSPVHGTVTYQGKPVAAAQVMFTPESGPMSLGETDSEGRYTIHTGTRPGAVPGKQIVTIMAYESTQEINSEQERAMKPLVSRIPMRYSDLTKSGLTAEVSPDHPNEINFTLE